MNKTYTVEWCVVKKEGETNGRAWKITEMTLKDADGVLTENVSTFDPVQNGATIEGEIVPKGQYLNFVTKKAEGKKPNMDRLIDKKQAGIAESQQRKEQSILAAQDRSAWMWAKTSASTLIANSKHFQEGRYGVDIVAAEVIDLATKIYNGEPTEPFTS